MGEDAQLHTQYLSNAERILVVLPKNSSFCQQLAASSLFLSLKQSNKFVSFLGVEKITNDTIYGLSELKTTIGANNLVIGFEYDKKAVDSVSYHIDQEENKFFLTIKPQKGCSPLDKSKIEYSYVGSDADLVIIFGASNFEELEQLYFGYEDLFHSANVLSISSYEPSYQCNFIDVSQYSSICETIYYLISGSGLLFNADVSTNLLAGIQYETNNFLDPRANAKTFAAIASLLNSGARRRNEAYLELHNNEFNSQTNFVDQTLVNDSSAQGNKVQYHPIQSIIKKHPQPSDGQTQVIIGPNSEPTKHADSEKLRPPRLKPA